MHTARSHLRHAGAPMLRGQALLSCKQQPCAPVKGALRRQSAYPAVPSPALAGQPAPELQYSAGVGQDASDLWEAMEEKYMRGREPLPDVRERQQRQDGAAREGRPAAPAAERPAASQQQGRQLQQQQHEEAG